MDCFAFSIAAAKLANATQRNNRRPSPDTAKHKHHRRHHHKKHPTLSPTGASFKSVGSNGSGGENFSTDDAEEANTPNIPPSPNYDQLPASDNKNSSKSKLLPEDRKCSFPLRAKK